MCASQEMLSCIIWTFCKTKSFVMHACNTRKIDLHHLLFVQGKIIMFHPNVPDLIDPFSNVTVNARV